jgi:hypothetical protein
MNDQFTYRRSRTCGYKLLVPYGRVFAWTIDTGSAAMIVAALNCLGLDTQPPQCHLESGTGAIETTARNGGRSQSHN